MKKKILVADDEIHSGQSDFRDKLISLEKSIDAEIEFEEMAENVVPKLKKSKYDLLLLDGLFFLNGSRRLQNMLGADVLLKIRKSKNINIKIPILGISSTGASTYEIKTKKHQVKAIDAYASKYDFDLVKNKIKMMLGLI